MKMSGNTILITGGTSGIGRALAEQFYKRKNHVIITGRRQSLLNEITEACPSMTGIELDVQEINSIKELEQRVQDEYPSLNVLVANAGITREEAISEELDVSVARSVIKANILGVLDIVSSFLPHLKKQSKATIIGTTSGLASVPRSNFPTYCASKAFLHSWLQSLRHQLRNSSIEVFELAPPYVQTALHGQEQLTDPNAMPLDAYIEEVMTLLDQNNIPSGEILVERVKFLWHARENGDDRKSVV